MVKCCADRDSPDRAHRESPDPYPVSPKVPFAAVDPILAPVPARQERSDDYPCIARLNDRWRVIRCADDVQWILQRRKGVLWFGNSYHRTAKCCFSGSPSGVVRLTPPPSISFGLCLSGTRRARHE